MSLGSYKSVADMNAKHKTYMKHLKAQADIQRQNTNAFKNKSYAHYNPTPVKPMDIYTTTQEKQQDIIAQRQEAREHVMEILKYPSDIQQFLDLLEQQTSVDPISLENVGSPVALFNIYFGELKEMVKRLSNITPQHLMKSYTRLLQKLES